jgi:hypothetical protein
MNKLTQQAKDTIKLIQRSPDIGDGWRAVSPVLRPNMPTWLKSAEELYEFDGERIRLTTEGQTIVRYL